MTRRFAAALVAMAMAVAAAGCGGNATTTPASTLAATTPSVSSPGGAVAGFLAAARNQDNSQIPVWLATTADATDLAELLRVYSDFGGAGGIFWEVAGVTVTDVSNASAAHDDVTLSGDIVWCIGKAANDPAATCSDVTPVTGIAHTYVATEVNGQWKADIDINASSGIDHNPEASPTAGAPTPTPSPT